ncbi:MAG: glycosyltransferase [Burkholderiales bacterium]|nr:glycosyltransferase [Burkholderiales bacterium]
MSKLSVIVPVYNTEKYIERCLDSIVNQTYFNQMEVIVINDGSTDNSQLIIDGYVTRYNNIRAFIKPNGGLSDARNFGLQFVAGKYLAFLDSDDWVDAELYEKCINYMLVNSKVEVLHFNYVEEWNDDVSRVIDSARLLYRSKYFTSCVAWNKVFLTSYWRKHNFRFYVGIKHEDLELIPKIIYYTNDIACLHNSSYYLHYDRSNISSIMNSKRDIKSFKASFDSLMTFNSQVNDELLTRYIATTFFFQLILFGGNPRESWNLYRKHRSLFSFENIDSKYSRIILSLERLHMGLVIKWLIFILDFLKANPNKI